MCPVEQKCEVVDMTLNVMFVLFLTKLLLHFAEIISFNMTLYYYCIDNIITHYSGICV